MFFEWYYHICLYRAHVYLVKFLFVSFLLLPVGEIKILYCFIKIVGTECALYWRSAEGFRGFVVRYALS